MEDEITFQFEDSGMAMGFADVPNIFLMRKDVSYQARFLYCVLVGLTNGQFGTLKVREREINDIINDKDFCVYDYAAELEREEFIRFEFDETKSDDIYIFRFLYWEEE